MNRNNTISYSWQDRIYALNSFYRREGHALVPVSQMEGDMNLGSWVSYIRTQYRKGRVSPEQVRELESYNGWAWGPLPRGPRSDDTRDKEIRKLRKKGMSLNDIGIIYGLSRQRIHQIVS